ncbi:unnamed protein product [Adineta steineri]|uniref:Uncharacterized protein n=1 Tax=Adineta steineri TaxID=433720 RepID=A0A818R702_9BILA|nr:unnamed protein product [Adineta steineri]
MKEDENKDKFFIQEYECGEKTNLYRIENQRKCVNVSTINKKSNLSFLSLFRAFFYPDNYPLSVSSDYGIYQFYNIFQTGCIAISGALAFSALFRGMGVGENTSKYLSAAIVWLLKDGAGMIGRIIFAWGFASSLDADCKRWHFLGDILNDVACILDLITPYFQPALLFISSISNICRAVTGVIHGSTRTVIFQHQARHNNVADITAKCSSLETMVSLVALFVNVALLSILPISFIWPIFIILTCGHLWGNYKAKRCILFNVFNHQRFHLVCLEYFQTNGKQILSIEQVNDQEPILFKTSIPYYSHIGMSLNSIPERIFPTQEQLEKFHTNEYERFLILYDKQTNTFYVLLKPHSDTDDLIRINFFIEILSCAMNTTREYSNEGFHQLINRIRKQLPNLNTCIDILHEDNNKCYEQFKQICLQNGYNFHRCLFNIDVYRIQ